MQAEARRELGLKAIQEMCGQKLTTIDLGEIAMRCGLSPETALQLVGVLNGN
jgi:hypothetical protein